MSGGSVPYHLRQNKTVDRGVFVDLLLMISRCMPAKLRDYRYIGFAGPFSEDFKLIHSQTGIKRFISVEMDGAVLKRQRWNEPLRGIDYRHSTSQAYIDTHDASEPSIVWLDYASPRELGFQLSELESLVSKAADYDVIKVTFNSSVASLGHDPAEGDGVVAQGPATVQRRIDKARARLGVHLPFGFSIEAEDVQGVGYPCLILKAAEHAVKSGMAGKHASRFQLMTAFTYQDSEHRMLTMTGLVLPHRKATAFLRDSGVAGWNLARTKWGSPRTVPIDISIPEMSLRERLFVDQLLPRRGSPKAIVKKLGFRLGGKVEQDTVRSLTSYRDFYRYFPYFSKMTV